MRWQVSARRQRSSFDCTTGRCEPNPQMGSHSISAQMGGVTEPVLLADCADTGASPARQVMRGSLISGIQISLPG